MTFGDVSYTFLSRLRMVFDFWKSVPGQCHLPLKPFGIRLAYVSCNSIATRRLGQTNLYVSIRLVQPFHRFGSGPLRLYTFGATLPQVRMSAIRFDYVSITFDDVCPDICICVASVAIRLYTFGPTVSQITHRIFF